MDRNRAIASPFLFSVQDAECDEGFFDLSTRASGESKICCSIFDLNVDLCEEDFSDIGYR